MIKGLALYVVLLLFDMFGYDAMSHIPHWSPCYTCPNFKRIARNILYKIFKPSR